MGVLLAFAVGYIVGARAGDQGFDEIRSPIKEIRESEEMAALLTALRSHLHYALRQVSDHLGDEFEASGAEDVVERVRRMMGQDPTARAS